MWFTKVWGVYNCNDCGAFAKTPEEIIHYKSCEEGSSERWVNYYEEK